jgi:hypothetical protein
MSVPSPTANQKVVTLPTNSTLRKLDIVRADQVTKKRIAWLWPNYIPLGCTTSLTGFPGHAKSMACCSIVAAVTTGGIFPDGSESTLPPSDCLVLSLEDDTESVLVPRLEAAGADLKRVHIIKSALVGNKDAFESGKATYAHVALDTDRDAIQKSSRTIRIFACLSWIQSPISLGRSLLSVSRRFARS